MECVRHNNRMCNCVSKSYLKVESHSMAWHTSTIRRSGYLKEKTIKSIEQLYKMQMCVIFQDMGSHEGN